MPIKKKNRFIIQSFTNDDMDAQDIRVRETQNSRWIFRKPIGENCERINGIKLIFHYANSCNEQEKYKHLYGIENYFVFIRHSPRELLHFS